MFDVAEEAIRMHRAAFGNDPVLANALDAGGDYAFRIRGEEHLWTPDAIAKLQHSTRTNQFSTFKEYSRIINDQSQRHLTLRGLFEFCTANVTPVPLDEVLLIINYYGFDFVKRILQTISDNLPNHSILLARAIFKLNYTDFKCSEKKPFVLHY